MFVASELFLTDIKDTRTAHSHYISQYYQNLKKDKFINEYGLVFISNETFTKIKMSSDFKISGSNFFISNQPIKLYTDNRVSYGIFDNNNLIAGRNPVEKFDVVISNEFFEQFKFFSGFQNIDECLDMEIEYKDLNNSPNRDLYQSMLNMHDITDKVKIVGVSDDYSSQVFVTQYFMDSILLRENLYLSGFFVDVVSFDIVGRLIDLDTYFNLSFLDPILSLKNLINSDFMFIILAAISIVLLSTITFLCLTFISNVKAKYKEIAILKSFGTKKKNIYALFFILNYAIAFISIVLGLALSILSLHFVNIMLMSPTVFGINYFILDATPFSFLIVIIITLLAALFSTLLALNKVSKIDVALALKMF